MSTRLKRLLLAVLALSAAVVGFWAVIAPRSWYDSFPSPGRNWVSTVGPYNEHLVRDVGGLYLALLVISLWTLLRSDSALLRVTGLAWFVFSLPHLVFHLGHLDGLATFDKVAEATSLALTLVFAVLLMLPSRSSDR